MRRKAKRSMKKTSSQPQAPELPAKPVFLRDLSVATVYARDEEGARLAAVASAINKVLSCGEDIEQLTIKKMGTKHNEAGTITVYVTMGYCTTSPVEKLVEHNESSDAMIEEAKRCIAEFEQGQEQ